MTEKERNYIFCLITKGSFFDFFPQQSVIYFVKSALEVKEDQIFITFIFAFNVLFCLE